MFIFTSLDSKMVRWFKIVLIKYAPYILSLKENDFCLTTGLTECYKINQFKESRNPFYLQEQAFNVSTSHSSMHLDSMVNYKNWRIANI